MDCSTGGGERLSLGVRFGLRVTHISDLGVSAVCREAWG